MTWIVVIGLILLGLLFSGLFSGLETGLYCVNRLRLALGARKRDRRALRLIRSIEDETGALTATLIGTNTMNYLTTGVVAYLFSELLQFSDVDTELFTVIALTPILFVFGEVVPKNLFQSHADRLMPRCSWLLACVHGLLRMTGLLWLLGRMADGVNRCIGLAVSADSAVTPKRQVAVMLQEALAGNSLGEQHTDLIDRVCRISDTPLHGVMVPRNRVAMIAAKANRRELVRVVRRTGHARLPVFEHRRTHIVGTVKVDDLLRRTDWSTVGERIDPVVNLAPHDTVATAIARLQESGYNMAIVSDRGGRLLGTVTFSDLLKEIVGEVNIPA